MKYIKLAIDCGDVECEKCEHKEYEYDTQFCRIFSESDDSYQIIEGNKRCKECLNAEIKSKPHSGIGDLNTILQEIPVIRSI